MRHKSQKQSTNKSIFLYLTLALAVLAALAIRSIPSTLESSAHARGHTESVAADQVLARFIQTETQFRETLIHYSFKRDAVLQTIGANGEVTGEYLRNSVFVLNDRGERVEKVTFHPKSTMKDLTITQEDIQDLAGSQLFGLELGDLNAYSLSYLTPAELNGRSVHVISIGPKQTPDPHHMKARFFVGKVYVDAETFQAIKLEGTTEPHGKQRFATFITNRSMIIPGLLVPANTAADDVLHFPKKDVRYRISVRYYDFKKFAGRVSIVELD